MATNITANTADVIRHEEVNVCGSKVLATVTQDNRCYFSPRHVCHALGIDWPTQYTKIKSDQVLSQGVVEIPTPSVGGTQMTKMLPIEFLSGWLFTRATASCLDQEGCPGSSGQAEPLPC